MSERTRTYETAGEITATLCTHSRKGKKQKRVVAILNTKIAINTRTYIFNCTYLSIISIYVYIYMLIIIKGMWILFGIINAILNARFYKAEIIFYSNAVVGFISKCVL